MTSRYASLNSSIMSMVGYSFIPTEVCPMSIVCKHWNHALKHNEKSWNTRCFLVHPSWDLSRLSNKVQTIFSQSLADNPSALQADLNYVVTGATNGSISIFNRATGEILKSLYITDSRPRIRISAIEIHRQQNVFAAVNISGKIAIFALKDPFNCITTSYTWKISSGEKVDRPVQKVAFFGKYLLLHTGDILKSGMRCVDWEKGTACDLTFDGGSKKSSSATQSYFQDFVVNYDRLFIAWSSEVHCISLSDFTPEQSTVIKTNRLLISDKDAYFTTIRKDLGKTCVIENGKMGAKTNSIFYFFDSYARLVKQLKCSEVYVRNSSHSINKIRYPLVFFQEMFEMRILNLETSQLKDFKSDKFKIGEVNNSCYLGNNRILITGVMPPVKKDKADEKANQPSEKTTSCYGLFESEISDKQVRDS